jgi:hypothetical protein
MRTGLLLLTLLIVIALAGCGGAPTPATAATPATWLVAALPAGAIPVAEAKQSARVGDQVVVRGRIGGRREPMTAGVAVFVMIDPAIPHCEIGKCKAPWDYCCETPESITTNSATVQLVGDNGKPMTIDLGKYALKPLDEIVVVGTVGPRPTPEVFIINAKEIHRIAG